MREITACFVSWPSCWGNRFLSSLCLCYSLVCALLACLGWTICKKRLRKHQTMGWHNTMRSERHMTHEGAKRLASSHSLARIFKQNGWRNAVKKTFLLLVPFSRWLKALIRSSEVTKKHRYSTWRMPSKKSRKWRCGFTDAYSQSGGGKKRPNASIREELRSRPQPDSIWTAYRG